MNEWEQLERVGWVRRPFESLFFFRNPHRKNSVSLSSAVSAAAAVLDTLHTLGQTCHTQGPQAGPNTQRHRKQLARVKGVRLS